MIRASLPRYGPGCGLSISPMATAGGFMRCCWTWTRPGSRSTRSPWPGQRAGAGCGPTRRGWPGESGRSPWQVLARCGGWACWPSSPRPGIAIQRDAADPRLAPSRLILAAARRLESVRDIPVRQPGPADALAARRPGRTAAGPAEPEATR